MSPLLLQLAVGAAFVLGAAALGTSAIMAEQRQRRRFNERLVEVAAPYTRVNPLTVMGRSPASVSTPMVRMTRAAAHLFGYDPARAAQYPVRWPIALGLTLGLARAVAALVGIFAGTWALLIVPPVWGAGSVAACSNGANNDGATSSTRNFPTRWR